MDAYQKITGLISSNKQKAYFIHYSCQTLSDENEGYSPRITSIAVLHALSSQMHSFSVHLVAEEMGIPREEIFDRYDDIERQMLKNYFDFLATKRDNSIWVHWNMSNINYGFEALEHRFRVLTHNEPIHIDEKNKFNLSTIIKKKFGADYVKHPQMVNLMELNGGRDRHFLSGEEEVRAFKAKEFIKLHNSTMYKTYFFREVFNRLISNTLRTENNQFKYKLNQLYQNPMVQILGIIGIIGSLFALVYGIIKK